MKEEKVYIKSTGILLEGLQFIQKDGITKGGVILCHPHPLYGGNMFNSVIGTATKVAQQEGFSTFRFNYRGVGESEGSYGDGIGEMDDVKAAIDYLHSKVQDTSQSLILLGYSFGVKVGFPVAINDDRVKAIIAIAPTVEFDTFDYLKGCKKYKLFIAGDEDIYCPSDKIKELFKGLDEPKHLFIINGADHFFFDKEQSIIEPLRDFLRDIIREKTF